MCIWLPNWPVQQKGVRTLKSRPLVLFTQSSRGLLVVVACSRSPTRYGVRTGMPLAEAESLCVGMQPEPEFVRHDPDADRRTLRRLALYCHRYTPVVALEEAETPECLLLDVGGSAHLFGGERALGERVVADFRRLGYAVRVAIADGIGAAWALAHAREVAKAVRVLPAGRNREIVSRLRVEGLRLPAAVIERLHQFDLRRIGQVLEVPRTELVTRFGPELLLRLDQALGRRAELVPSERQVEPIEASWRFEDPVAQEGVLEAVTERLVRKLARRLEPEQMGVRRLYGTIEVADDRPVSFEIGMLRPTGSAERLLELIRLRLEGLRLSAGILRVALRVAAAPLEVRQERWFDSDEDARRQAAFREFVERLSSRLGEEAVLRPCLRPDDQPEWAWDYVPWLRERSSTPLDERKTRPLAQPVNLLAGPQAIHVEEGQDGPCRFGWRERSYAVARAWGPQRIETGWWRGDDVRRDYYRVEAQTGERFWLYRDLARGTWYLHGVFA